MTGSKTCAGLLALSLVSLGGCAGNPTTVADVGIDAAEQRLDEAERANAQRYANQELNLAREKLIAAREAAENGDEEEAARLARHAELDATYAAAVADNELAQTALDELRETLATLESELERQQSEGADAPPPGGRF